MRTCRSRTDSRAQGMVLALVVMVCGLLGVIGAATYLQSSGTGRAFARVLSTRSAVEAGDAALAEAAAAIRISMDTGATGPVCPENWKALVCALIQAAPPGTVQLAPEGGRTHTLHPAT